MTIKFKNLTQLNLVEFASELKTSNVIRFLWARLNFTTRNWKRLKRSRVSRTLATTETRTKSSAEFAGAQKKMHRTPSSSHASAEVLLVLFISNVWKTGCSLRNKKSHLTPRTKTCALSTGSVSNVKFASTCIHILSRLEDRYTRSLTCRNKWTSRTTTFY